MRIFLLSIGIGLGSIYANPSYAQTKISIDANGITYEELFNRIQGKSEFIFFYKDDVLDPNKRVFLTLKKAELSTILDRVFENTTLEYSIDDRQVVIKNNYVPIQSGLLSSLLPQDFTVTGTVTDNDGVALAGASVLEKGTTNGTQSDFDGNYALSLSSASATLTVSYIGFGTKVIPVNNQNTISIVLDESAAGLDEVIVVGYGTQKKSDVTGALTSVSSTDFEKQPLNDVNQALQGRAAGVQVTQTSGAPGGAFKVRIRGANSITGGNEPLYVVDGQFVDISSLNVNDIKSMEVLKDASATAIYGTRGANGVVLITTKNGTKGKTTINVDLFSGISNVTQKLDLLSASEFAEGVVFAENVDSNEPNPFFTTQEIAELRQNGGEDWQELIFRNAYFKNVQVSASGGSDAMDYYISGNFYETDGTVQDEYFRKLNLRTNLNAKLTKRIKAGVNFNVRREQASGARGNISRSLAFDPTTPAFDENGNYNFNSIKNLATSETNPLVAVENNNRNNVLDRLSVNGNLNYDITDHLVLNISGGIVRQETHNSSYQPLISSATGRADVDNFYSTNLFNTNRLTYALDVGDNSEIKIDAVHELVIDKNNNVNITATDFFTDLVTYKDLSAASVQQVVNREGKRELESFLGRMNFSSMGRYFLTASIRADGTSVFQNEKWGYFPSASFAWRISEEKFLERSENLDNLKFRLSYGKVGNQGIGVFGTRSRAVLGIQNNYPFNGSLFTGVAPSSRVDNPDLTWETTEQFNAGLDIALWRSALTLSVDVYKKNTQDLLLDTQLPQFVGPTSRFVNAGEVENKGFEITLGTRVLNTDDWNIESTLSVSSNKNKVLALYDDVQFLEVGSDVRGFTVNPTRVEIGLPISTFRGYIFDGVYQLGEEEQGIPGNAKYRDISGPEGIPDGIITTDDITTVGDGNADFVWGWNWDLNYKNWNLNFLLTGSEGNDIYNIQRSRLMALGPNQFHATYGEYRNRWTPTNPSNIPSGRDGTEALSSQFIEDGSFVTMKSLTLGYNFSQNLIQKLGLSNARLYASVENLFIITEYSGFDPEATASAINNADADVGIDYNSYPINRSITLGLNVSF